MEIAAVLIGVLIGLLTGAIANLALLSATQGTLDVGKLGKLGAYLLAVASAWFGGSWVSGQIVSSVKWPDVLQFYTLGLLVGFCPLFAYTAWRLAVKIGREFGK
ncbi:MAG TPA: hypothetical protein VFC31_06840 [Candidatus Limnocylindria bacterium]|nr:hypothetical protein [Candidatus Limnocylindria bacterium]